MVTSDDIARRVAERLAAANDHKLVVHVEHALAEGDDEEDEGPHRDAEPVLVVGLARFVVSVSQLAWSIYRDEHDRAERRASSERPEEATDGETAFVEVAYLRELIQGRLATTVDIPRTLTHTVRMAVLDAAAEETVAAGQKVIAIR